MSQLLQSASRVAGLGPALSLPLFDGGARRAALAGAEAGRDAQIAQYNQTVLDAVREVADQAASLRAGRAIPPNRHRPDPGRRRPPQRANARPRRPGQRAGRAGAGRPPWLAQRRQAVELNTAANKPASA